MPFVNLTDYDVKREKILNIIGNFAMLIFLRVYDTADLQEPEQPEKSGADRWLEFFVYRDYPVAFCRADIRCG